MGWSESGRECKKHQLYGGDDMMMKQYSSPGVCSSCLSERLSQLYAPSSTFFSERLVRTVSSPRNQSNSSSSSVSSSAVGSPPVNNYYYSTSFSGRGPKSHHRRHASEILGSVSFVTRSSTGTGGGFGCRGDDDDDHGVMKKSRSVAAAVVSKINHHRFGDQKASSSGGKQQQKKKRGFWSKLLRTTGSKTKEVLKHSERV